MRGWQRLVGVPRRAWFQILLSGLVLFYALEKLLRSTHNPNFVPSVLLLGAFLVPVTMVMYLYESSPVHDIPLPSLAVSFLWGGIVGVVIAGFLEYQTLRSLGVLPLLGVGLIEESAKLAVPLVIYVRGRYRSETDGLLFGVASGMGFAALETMGYGFVALLASRGSIGILEETLLVRGLLSPAGHAAWTGIVCAVLWRERLRAGHPVLNLRIVGAFVLVVVLHALWDTFNGFRGVTFVEFLGLELLSFLVALASLTLLIRRIREARREAVQAAASPTPA